MSDSIRAPAVAGRFYPGGHGTLNEALHAWMEESPPVERRPAVGLLVPHAGYVYSGKVAAQAYRRLQPPARAIVLCPNHTGQGRRISVWPSGRWVTPLGESVVDERLAAGVMAALGETRGDEEAHRLEHAVEVQLPFLQYLDAGTRIVPVALGRLTLEDCLAAGDGLARLLSKEGKGTLLVASTDMSHYVADSEARRLDRLALDRVEALDPEGLYRTVADEGISMCGFIPSTIVLRAAIGLGAKSARLLAYATSGDVSGDRESVVGYASVWIE